MYFWFFSNLVGEEPKIINIKGNQAVERPQNLTLAQGSEGAITPMLRGCMGSGVQSDYGPVICIPK